ncbi:hypothetical protein ACIPY5_09330 [Microbacterium sp. NPDC089698]|uniref:hypothetical protein n=1 Tax=Microbacterium sp. NPDC089698 TaxID=3364200 RepID=UPI0038142930
MNETTLTAAERIRAFADAVRAQLADLPADEVDDLVEGLVGDLTDQAADHDGAIELGDPAAYAEELRSAAGLPERGPLAAETKTPWHERIAARAGRAAGRIRSSAFGAWLLDLLIALRPVWWVLRGLVLAALVLLPAGLGPRTLTGYSGMPAQVYTWALVVLFALVSVQWGRGRWLPKNWLRHVRVVASIIALLAMPALFGYFTTIVVNSTSVRDYSYEAPRGLLLDGAQIGNLFVYDRDGNPITGAQLYTDKGTPVNLYGSDSADLSNGVNGPWQSADMVTVPFRDNQGRPIWNIYPLHVAQYEPSGAADTIGDYVDAKPPFLRAPARMIAIPEPSPGATNPATSGTATPTPQPSVAAPTPTPTPAG